CRECWSVGDGHRTLAAAQGKTGSPRRNPDCPEGRVGWWESVAPGAESQRGLGTDRRAVRRTRWTGRGIGRGTHRWYRPRTARQVRSGRADSRTVDLGLSHGPDRILAGPGAAIAWSAAPSRGA